jgi:hypothetical protein
MYPNSSSRSKWESTPNYPSLVPGINRSSRSKWETTPDYSKLAPGVNRVYEQNFGKEPGLISTTWWNPNDPRSREEESKRAQNKKHSPEVFYYTLNISNTTLSPAALTIAQNLSQPIIDHPEDYEMSIVRFTVPGNNLPIFKFKTGDEEDPDNNVYSIAIIYNNAGAIEKYFYQLEYIPSVSQRDTSINVPVDYNVYNYANMIKMMNNALGAAFDEFDGDFAQANRNKPYFTFNPVTQLISLNVNNYWNVSPISIASLALNDNMPAIANGEAQIWISDGLYPYLRGFNLFKCTDGYDDAPTSNMYASYMFNLIDIGGVPGAAASTTVVPVAQEFNTLGSWNDVRGIVITTNSLPILKEQFPIISTDLDNQDIFKANINVNGAFNTSNVISDFVVTNNGPDLFQPLEYLPTAEYRMFAMTGSAPIRIIDLQFQWIDKNNRFNQLYLGANDCATVKMLFRKKKNCC